MRVWSPTQGRVGLDNLPGGPGAQLMIEIHHLSASSAKKACPMRILCFAKGDGTSFASRAPDFNHQQYYLIVALVAGGRFSEVLQNSACLAMTHCHSIAG